MTEPSDRHAGRLLEAHREGSAIGCIMAKPAGARCNLACTYCYYLSKERLFPGDEHRRMPEELLERYIAERLETATEPAIHFEWHGGEPTILGLSYFRRIAEIEHRYRRTGQIITNGLQTNGILLDGDWARFLAEERFSVGLSIDGPEEIHDVFRKGKDGRPSHRLAVRAFRLLERHKVHTDVLCVLHSANVRSPDTVYRFFQELGVRYLQFLPLVEPQTESNDGLSERTPTAAALGEFLCVVFDEWVRDDIGRIVVQWFDEALRPYCGVPHALCIFRETCGDVPVIEHEGSLFVCDHFVDPAHLLGNIREKPLKELLCQESLIDFGRRKRDALPRCCRECDVLAWCHGGCPKDRISTSTEGEEGLNYLCAGLKRFFHHSRPVMARLASFWRAGRPISLWSADLRGSGIVPAPFTNPMSSVSRNAPCPCGSGLKYKKCCLRSRS